MLKRIDQYLGLACTQNEWRFLFGIHYDVLRPYLLATPKQAPVWCCPSRGSKLSLIEEGASFTALSPDYEAQPELEVNHIPPDALQIWEFSPALLMQHLCARFGLQAAPKPMGQGVWRMGTLPHRTRRLPVFLLTRIERSYLPLAKSTVADHTENGLFYTPQYCPDTADWLRQKQHGYFPLEDLLEIQTLEPLPAYRKTLQSFLASLPSFAYRPDPDIQVVQDYRRIIFPDGYEINLSRAYKRRAIVRFIVEWVRQSEMDTFDVEIVREDYNGKHSEHPWDSDRIREDLFKRNVEDFDRLFETLDASNGQYRLKI